MGRLIYSAITSLDGYIADRDGNFDWGVPDVGEFRYINDLMRGIGTHLYGRRMYEVMIAWEDPASMGDDSPNTLDFAQMWQDADKIVFSRTLTEVSTKRTRIEREFTPELIRELKRTSERDLVIAGAELGGLAIRAGLVDDYHFFVCPVIIGGGNAALPADASVRLELAGERRFDNGVVHLRYQALG